MYDTGLELFFKKTKLASVNQFLVGRVFLHYTIDPSLKNKEIEYMENLISKNMILLNDLSKFRDLFISFDEKHIELH